MPPPDTKLRETLEHFAHTFDVPAVGGGIVGADCDSEFEVVGTCRRGEDVLASLDHQWHIGSCAKSMTAALFARLVEDGRADWQQTIGSLFQDLRNDIHPAWHERPIDELFYCRGGMRANPSIRSMLASWKDARPLRINAALWRSSTCRRRPRTSESSFTRT